ncbi:DUF4255 domain-containing protein [Pukyongia salina]|uniref:DUF4255 domain-containing protein n=1 Tax=Pukyongia salina TaxID=2094025 RepID=A0A2S0HV00_9FLAO|nr:DUF4255 domain-containing protein [Pukyongia salina]AVI50438.1 DUF4255 domain-containing protein [Pukyongia salina]
MISKALSFLTKFLNQEISLKYGLDTDMVVPSSLTNPDGSIADNVHNKIVLSIINVEHETYVKSSGNFNVKTGNTYGKIAPPVHLNIYLLVSANFDSKNYLEALKMLSAVITVFQANPYFTSDVNPEMQEPLTKLTLEIMNLPVNELSHIWSGIGAKYVPSLLYKMRMITLSDERIKKQTPSIFGLEGKADSK